MRLSNKCWILDGGWRVSKVLVLRSNNVLKPFLDLSALDVNWSLTSDSFDFFISQYNFVYSV